jgi:hypothetical protein
MLKTISAMLLPALVLTAGTAAAQRVPQHREKQVTIPLVGGSSVRTFQPTRRGDAVYIQSFRGDWYLARLYGPCFDLPYATSIGFKSFSSMSLDRGDTIIAGRQQCKIASIVRSGPPPKKAKKHRRS